MEVIMALTSSSAYEIAKYWGEEPPPREILEDITAKGGDLRTRTLDSFQRRKADNRNDDDGEESGDEGSRDTPRTPRPDQTDAPMEEPASGNRYPSRT